MYIKSESYPSYIVLMYWRVISHSTVLSHVLRNNVWTKTEKLKFASKFRPFHAEVHHLRLPSFMGYLRTPRIYFVYSRLNFSVLKLFEQKIEVLLNSNHILVSKFWSILLNWFNEINQNKLSKILMEVILSKLTNRWFWLPFTFNSHLAARGDFKNWLRHNF